MGALVLSRRKEAEAPIFPQTGAVGQHLLMAGYGPLLNTKTVAIEPHPQHIQMDGCDSMAVAYREYNSRDVQQHGYDKSDFPQA